MLEGGIDRRTAQEIARKLDELAVLDYFNVVARAARPTAPRP